MSFLVLAVLAAAECESSDRSAGKMVAELGRLNAKDDANHADYSFVVCHTFNVFEQKGRLNINSSLTGTVIELKDVEGLSDECIQRGAPYSPTSASDPRRIEYKLCRDHLEINATVLDKKGAAKPMQSLKLPLPDLHLQPKTFSPFPKASMQDKSVSCETGEKELGKLDAKDEANMTTYRFVVCQRENKDVTVHSNFLTGTIWTAAAIAGQADGTECSPFGAPYGEQGPGDARRIKYELCGKHVEVTAITLDANFGPHAPKKVSAPLKL